MKAGIFFWLVRTSVSSRRIKTVGTVKRKERLFFKAALIVLLCLGILCIVVKDFIDDRQLKKDIEANPYYQSLYRTADAINMVRGRSFAELNHNERHKVVMKCAEAYALATLPSSQPLDDDPGFRRYLLGLRIVTRTHYLSENVKQVNQAIDMIRDYLWSLYDGYDYDY